MCTVFGCDNPVSYKTRGFCNAHYLRWNRHGDPLAGGPLRYADPEKAFEAYTIPEPNTGCLLWIGATHPYGHAQITVSSNVRMYAHRYAWERDNGPIPDGMLVDHICHTPQCVNADHLRLATKAENMQNRPGPQKNNTSGFRNVYWNKEKRAWDVQITKNRKTYRFGRYKNKEEAVQVAERERKNLLGEFAGFGK